MGMRAWVVCAAAVCCQAAPAAAVDLSETPAASTGTPRFTETDPMRGLLSWLARDGAVGIYADDWIYYQYLAQMQSFVGRYRDAQVSFDKVEEPAQPVPAEPADLANLRPEPALEAIVEAAAPRRAVFINEAHHVPQHRAFTTRLLERLHDEGYRYFAAEALSSKNMDWNGRGYPAMGRRNGNEPGGPYTEEPLFGDLLRTALRLGYTIVAYEEEDGGECQNPPEDKNFCQNRRERAQARNLKARVFDKDPDAKVLVHAGYGHIDKLGAEGWSPMAKYFMELTGIDPFVVDQAQLREHPDERLDSPGYRAALAELKPKVPVVLRGPGGSWWTESRYQGHYDAQVLHPRARYKKGRPDWLFSDGARSLRAVPRSACGAARPCLVRAYYEEEPDDAVPVDQVMSEPDGGLPALALPPGGFRLVASDASGKVLSTGPLRVKGKSGPGVRKPGLRERLLRLKADDQAARLAVIDGDFKNKTANRRLDAVDLRHLPVIRGIVEAHGWPTRTLVGADGAEAAWLLTQHADTDPDFQERCLKLVEPLASKGKVAPQEFALLTDRVRVNRGKPQVYGTQVREAAGGCYEPQPVEDPAGLEARRRAVGLEPEAAYLASMCGK